MVPNLQPLVKLFWATFLHCRNHYLFSLCLIDVLYTMSKVTDIIYFNKPLVTSPGDYDNPHWKPPPPWWLWTDSIFNRHLHFTKMKGSLSLTFSSLFLPLLGSSLSALPFSPSSFFLQCRYKDLSFRKQSNLLESFIWCLTPLIFGQAGTSSSWEPCWLIPVFFLHVPTLCCQTFGGPILNSFGGFQLWNQLFLP